MANSNIKAAPKTALEDEHLALEGDPWTPEGDFKQQPKGAIRIVGNAVWFSYYMNHPQDINKNRINIKMNINVSSVLLEAILEAANSPTTFKAVKVSVRGWHNNESSMGSNIVVDIDGSGRICIIATFEERIPTRFVFKPGFWYDVSSSGEGAGMSDGKRSAIVAKAWVRKVDALTSLVHARVWKEIVKDKGNNGGGYNNNNNGGGGYNTNNYSASQMNDKGPITADDIPDF